MAEYYDREDAPTSYQHDREVEQYVAGLEARDPAFQRGSFLRDCHGMFEDVTRNWAALNGEASRPWMLDELWADHIEGIRHMKQGGVQPVLEGLAVADVRITGAWMEDGWDCILVRFTAVSSDYKRGRLGRNIGSTKHKTWEEEWTFAKPGGESSPRSVAPGERCPSCGGPGDGSVYCPFCGQLRTDGRGFRDVWKIASIEELTPR